MFLAGKVLGVVLVAVLVLVPEVILSPCVDQRLLFAAAIQQPPPVEKLPDEEARRLDHDELSKRLLELEAKSLIDHLFLLASAAVAGVIAAVALIRANKALERKRGSGEGGGV